MLLSDPVARSQGEPMDDIMPPGNSSTVPSGGMRKSRVSMAEYQTLPSGPRVTRVGSLGWLLPVARAYSVITPEVEMRPILLPVFSVNHRAPSEPAAMVCGWLLGVGMRYSAGGPPPGLLGLKKPTWLVPGSTNQMLLSGPAVRPWGLLIWVPSPGTAKDWIEVPSVLARPMAPVPGIMRYSLNQTLPSG